MEEVDEAALLCRGTESPNKTCVECPIVQHAVHLVYSVTGRLLKVRQYRVK